MKRTFICQEELRAAGAQKVFESVRDITRALASGGPGELSASQG